MFVFYFVIVEEFDRWQIHYLTSSAALAKQGILLLSPRRSRKKYFKNSEQGGELELQLVCSLSTQIHVYSQAEAIHSGR